MRGGQAVAVSNGSFINGEGMAAWTIKGENKEGWCMGTSMVPGDTMDQSMFRSKLTRLYGIFLSLKYIAEGCEEDGLKIMVACDGKSAVDWLNSRKPIRPMEVHFDLLAAIQELQRQSLIMSMIIHVKVHQDLGVMMVLSRLAMTNIEMDEIAKQMVTMTKAQKGPNTIPEEPWSCAMKGRKLVKNIEKQLCKHINSPAIIGYWKTKQ